MAQRRMVSIKIIDSAKFIKMPVSCQSLYFHLIARADDDGIVEAFNVMRMVGASEDDLKILVAKQFATVLNEDLVTFINDWNEHNLIRADRKIDSIYQELLLQIVGSDEIKQKRERADRRKVLLIENICQNDVNGTSQGQPNDSIGKVRLGEVRSGKGKSTVEIEDFFERVWSLYPSKSGKGKISDATKSKVFKLGDEFIRCIDRYKQSKEEWKQWQNGSTFFNSGYVDYLDCNYKATQDNQNEYGPTKPVGFNTWPIEDKMKWLSENGGI